jgi:hypothetical protein
MGLFEQNPLLLIPVILVGAGVYDVLKHIVMALLRRVVESPHPQA